MGKLGQKTMVVVFEKYDDLTPEELAYLYEARHVCENAVVFFILKKDTFVKKDYGFESVEKKKNFYINSHLADVVLRSFDEEDGKIEETLEMLSIVYRGIYKNKILLTRDEKERYNLISDKELKRLGYECMHVFAESE